MAKSDGVRGSEIRWVIYYNRKNKPEYMITSTSIRDKYYLYQMVDGEVWKRIEKADSPAEFEERYPLRM